MVPWVGKVLVHAHQTPTKYSRIGRTCYMKYPWGGVPVEVEGLQTFEDFEVINIVDDTSPVSPGIDWEIKN